MTTATDTERLAEMDRHTISTANRSRTRIGANSLSLLKNGKTVTGTTAAEAMEKGVTAFGQGNYLFKIGERFVYRQRAAIRS